MPERQDFPQRLFLLLGVACALLSCLCLAPGLDGGFIFDDRVNIQQNTALHIEHLTAENLLYAAYSFQPGNGSRSLSMLSFALDYLRGGLDARTFKITNLLIHALTTLALALMLRRLLTMTGCPPRRAALGALTVAALWALHPLQVSTVLYVVQRMQMLVTLFMVLALWAYLGMRQAQIEHRRSRGYGLLAALFWVLGFAGKEDAVLLPAYTLAMELTVLRFAAASPRIAALWRRGYGLLVVAGIAFYALVALPHYWQWGAYPGRDFSSLERLLTQGRVLVIYLGQSLWPVPGSMPFFYDDLEISRGLLQPATTLPALLLLAGLLAWAWAWRHRRPLFALGILLFFAGHFLTSNVLNLELAFEHRNQFPMVGILLAAADLAAWAWQRLALPPRASGAVVMSMAAALGATTAARAHAWGDPVRFAAETVRLAPHSERAWGTLSGVFAERSGLKPGPDLDRAITISEQGATVAKSSALLLSNVVIFRTLNGTVTDRDWARFLDRLRREPMSAQNSGIVWSFLHNLQRNIPLDEDGVLETIAITTRRGTLTTNQYLQLASYVFTESTRPDDAFQYLRMAVESAAPDDPEIDKMLGELTEAGRQDWRHKLMDARKQTKVQQASYR